MGAETATAVAKAHQPTNNNNNNARATQSSLPPASLPGRPRGRSKAQRPKKKARAPNTPPQTDTTPPPPPPSVVQDNPRVLVPPSTSAGSRGMPENMDEYRGGCLRLEKTRHERVYQSEKRRYYAERAIEQSFEWEVRAAEEAYTAGVKAVVERLLLDNLARQQRLEERRFGITHRPTDNTAIGLYGNGGRPHGMSLRTRNGGGSGDEKKTATTAAEEELPPVDGGRASRRHRKEARNGNGGNGGNGNANHAQPRVKLMMALDEASVASDLAKISRSKRSREAENGGMVNERRNKKRK